MDQNRDFGIKTIMGRNVHCSGMGLGIILLDETYPGFPGDVRNPSAYPYPIQYEVARELDIKKLLHDSDKDQYLDTILTAALKLQKMGCRAIAAECGYFAFFSERGSRTPGYSCIHVQSPAGSLGPVHHQPRSCGRNTYVL